MSRYARSRLPVGGNSDDWRDRLRLTGRALTMAWAQFLGRVPWQWFVTLTFDPKRTFPVGKEKASREAFRWLGDTGRLLRLELAWVYAAERDRSGQWHVHALLVSPGLTQIRLRVPRLNWETRNGRFHCRPVRHPMRDALYTTKQAAATGEIVLSDALGRYKRELWTDRCLPLSSEPPIGDVGDPS